MATRTFTFVCGSDDFLVGRAGAEKWAALAEGLDEFSREVISGYVAVVDDVATVVKRFRESVQTLGLFGGRRAVWLKDVTFLADSELGGAQGTLELVADLQELLAAVNSDEVAVLITASPVDRRRSFAKWCEAHADFVFAGGGDGSKGSGPDWRAIADAECARWDVKLPGDALELLVAKTGANARLLVGEIEKLATYLGESGATITEDLIDELVASAGEGDFFEAAEAFFSRNLPRTLEAIRQHFFSGHDARPLLSSLQNRNRLLVQLRALMLAGDVRVSPRGVDKGGLERAAATCADLYRGSASEKSGYNIFTQNPWYLGKVVGTAELPALRRLIDHQLEFTRAFEEILAKDADQEEILRAMAIRCLST
ncbi:MAG: DNA polymerase III subunit delta [Opitutaceae bacterium]|nr:DNA polymerase III subunit delta [Opitutaceae bacterium]